MPRLYGEFTCNFLKNCRFGAATMENSMEVPQKIKNRTIRSSNFTSEYLKKMKTLIQKDICTAMCIAALLAIAKILKRNKLSVH